MCRRDTRKGRKMTDRELLELAAKAAGKRGLYRGDTIYRKGMYLYPNDEFWNPLTDDGDRYRLAKKLDLCVSFSDGAIVCGGVLLRDGVNNIDRAIVEVAAEIGKAME